MLYSDGCAVDGVPVRESILIAKRHPAGMQALVRDFNRKTDPTGKPYHFSLRTWAEEGICV